MLVLGYGYARSGRLLLVGSVQRPQRQTSNLFRSTSAVECAPHDGRGLWDLKIAEATSSIG